MISVRNRRPRSNGSNFLLLALLLFLGSACGTLKKTPTPEKKSEELESITGGKVYDPQTGTFVEAGNKIPTESLDTIQWTILPKSNYPPIVSSAGAVAGTTNPVRRLGVNEYGSELLSTYKATLLLPFMTQSFVPDATEFGETSNTAIQYYCGTKLALEELSSQGVSIELHVLDTKGSNRDLNNLIQSHKGLSESHLIIGPYQSDLLPGLIDFSRKSNKILVSPNVIPEKPFANNPGYIQVKPGFQRHCEALAEDALRKYKPEQIVLVARNRPSELEGLKVIQDTYRRIQGSSTVTPLKEYVVSLGDDATSVFESIDVLPFISLSDTTVFILPSWSNESFVFAFLRKLDLSRQNGEAVQVYGLPQWMRYERIDFDYYAKLNVHVSQNSFQDPNSNAVKVFTRTFFDRFGMIPSQDAFLGYDVMMYFGTMLHKYGTRFQYSLESEPYSGLNMSFDMERVADTSSGKTENLPLNRFENKHIFILRFQDYSFIPAARY